MTTGNAYNPCSIIRSLSAPIRSSPQHARMHRCQCMFVCLSVCLSPSLSLTLCHALSLRHYPPTHYFSHSPTHQGVRGVRGGLVVRVLMERLGVEIRFQLSVPPSPLANSAIMSTLSVHCQWEYET